MENQLADNSMKQYVSQIASLLNGEIDFKKVANLSFKGENIDMDQLLHLQQLMLERHPKISKHAKNCEITSTYVVDERGDVTIQAPPSLPPWFRRRIEGDDDQFRRRAKTMRGIQKKLEARGIKTKPIAPTQKPTM